MGLTSLARHGEVEHRENGINSCESQGMEKNKQNETVDICQMSDIEPLT
jgi:hypothetical protein